ncbi:hypothetical protein N7495_000359, partial [Penicillium taxi]|uniref:uncharacterized protein n=1 Tax=Penicillium taxi TaxID=168475 RepID=UPI0025451723
DQFLNLLIPLLIPIGPLIWAPLSEIYGRRHIFTISFAFLTSFNAGAAGAQNIQTLIILRFLAGCFGPSPFGNAGGTIADMFPASQRGIAMSLFAAAQFLGPTIGPVIGGFLTSGAGWRWVEGLLAALSGVLWLCIILLLPETYSPVFLRRCAQKLSQMTEMVYSSKLDIDRGPTSLGTTLKTALSRPWTLLFREPIVLLLSIYMSIIYGSLYMMFAAFPIVFQEVRGWNEGVGGLAFLGVLVGMCRETTDRLPPEGAQIRQRCTFAAEADAFMRRLTKDQAKIRREEVEEKRVERTASTEVAGDEHESSDSESVPTLHSHRIIGRLSSHASRHSGRSIHRVATATQYEENPYDLDLVNTRQSALSSHRKD